MDVRRVVVVEANEVPLRVLSDVAAMGRAPFIAELLHRDQITETVVNEPLPREMYPSQTWASLNTGVPWSDHQIWWYGDPKPSAYPMYWQVAARSGRSVGLVGTLHSSPLETQCADGDYRFAIPDCFASDANTMPSRFEAFQALNLRLTKANSRSSSLASARDDLGLVAKAGVTLGLKPKTVAEIGRLVAAIASGRVPRERLRSGQFLVLRDVFCSLLADEAPDLAMIFTNHVAAAMHRYWYAMYPDDFSNEHYSQEWVERHQGEIPAAVQLLDGLLQRLDRWCKANERTLVLVSSMGQGPSQRLESERTHQAVISDPKRFLAAVGVGTPQLPLVRGSMAPTLTLDCQSLAEAQRIAELMNELGVGRDDWEVDRVDEVVTVSYDIEVVDPATVRMNGIARPASELGIDIHPVDDHSSGRHIPEGIVAVSNSPTFKQPADGSVDQLDFAPAILDLLGVERLDHHRVPLLQL